MPRWDTAGAGGNLDSWLADKRGQLVDRTQAKPLRLCRREGHKLPCHFFSYSTDSYVMPAIDEQQVLDDLKSVFRQHVPAGTALVEKAFEDEFQGKEMDVERIKSSFSMLVEKIQLDAYRLYQEAERHGADQAYRTVLGPILTENPTKDDFFNLLSNTFWSFDRFFLGLSQGRRPRAGSAFEQVITVLFNAIGYPYTAQPVINGQPDFLLPSVEHWNTNSMDCIIFTVKRTLRERWRQITTEGLQGHQFFLATIDEGIGSRDLGEMLKHRIYLVMPETIRARLYDNQPNVISFEKFFQQHLDPAMTRWLDNGVLDGPKAEG